MLLPGPEHWTLSRQTLTAASGWRRTAGIYEKLYVETSIIGNITQRQGRLLRHPAIFHLETGNHEKAPSLRQ